MPATALPSTLVVSCCANPNVFDCFFTAKPAPCPTEREDFFRARLLANLLVPLAGFVSEDLTIWGPCSGP